MPKVYAIILNYNSADTLLECIGSVFRSQNILATTGAKVFDLHVVIVDNNSTDNSLTLARKKFSHADYIKNHENIGFAAGNNVGIRFALERGADYTVLINSDATLKSDALLQLFMTAQNLNAPSILCPQIFSPSGAIWYAGATIDWCRMRITHKTHLHKTSSPLLPIVSATGCVMSIHKDVFKKIGLLNESYFLYYEDADFSLCAKRKGIIVGLVPTAHATHHEVSERATNKPLKTYWLVLSALLFFTAHAPKYYKILYTILIPLRRLKNRFAPADKKYAPHIRRAFIDFPTAKKHYVRHY